MKTMDENKNYYQSSKLIERIDWDKLIPMERWSGGHDEQMQGLLKDVNVIAHYNDCDYQGQVATCVQLNDTQEIVIYNDYYGSCDSCDVWEEASDEEVKKMCIQLAGGALIFNNLDDCKKFLATDNEATQYDWNEKVRSGLLNLINSVKEVVE
jgi:hypothetical protein